MKIKLSEVTKINAALCAVNKNASAHCYTSASEIIALAESAEKRLGALGIAKKFRSGAVVRSTSGEGVPRAYKYSRNATEVRIVRFSTAWFLVLVAADTVYESGGSTSLRLTDAQDKIAVANLRATYCVESVATAV